MSIDAFTDRGMVTPYAENLCAACLFDRADLLGENEIVTDIISAESCTTKNIYSITTRSYRVFDIPYGGSDWRITAIGSTGIGGGDVGVPSKTVRTPGNPPVIANTYYIDCPLTPRITASTDGLANNSDEPPPLRINSRWGIKSGTRLYLDGVFVAEVTDMELVVPVDDICYVSRTYRGWSKVSTDGVVDIDDPDAWESALSAQFKYQIPGGSP